MNPPPPRIGSVPYLNARPLLRGLAAELAVEPILAEPAALASLLAAGAVDAALVPAYWVLCNPSFPLVADVAIASEGPVRSVFLAWPGNRANLADLHEIATDPASLTSVHLLRVLLAEYYGLTPRYRAGAAADDGVARLVIGDPALALRDRLPPDTNVLDLGEEWTRQTGLPFVYATWAIRPEYAGATALAAILRAAKRRGIADLAAIAAAEPAPAAALAYLTHNVRFDLGARERQGLARYAELLAKHHLLPGRPGPLRFL